MVAPLESCCVSIDASVRQAVALLESAGRKIVLVLHDERLVGTITDGDVRRAILRGKPLESPATEIMNASPLTVHPSAKRSLALRIMRQHVLQHLPVVEADGRLVDLFVLAELVGAEQRKSLAVLMAGGRGERLNPLTRTIPKPLLPVGERPLLELIIENFVSQGFQRIFISVNYKADLFKEHFGDGSAFGAQLDYLVEDRPLGTAGALSLLPEAPDAPVIVMNGDLVTSVDFSQLLDFHIGRGAVATMGVRDYSIQVPYGVVELDGERICGLEEKPRRTFFINAGIYVLSPEAVAEIPKKQPFNMTELFAALWAQQKEVVAFPIHEYWMDIGRMEDLERARAEYAHAMGK